LKRTQLFDYHRRNGKLTEFAGYEMPLWYTSITEEHLAVRNACGIFDVSHMGRLAIKGGGSQSLLEGLVPTSVQPQQVGKAFYTLLLNDEAGIIDDLIILRKAEDEFLAVVNAANKDRDLAHITERAAGEDVEIEDQTSTSAMMALQGPRATEALAPITGMDLASLKRFRCADTEVLGSPCTVSRTGYTGEDGFEIIVGGTTVEEPKRALDVWNALAESVQPCGLGARDSLRLEAGYPLHGSDIDEKTNPFEAGLSWVLSAGKADYVGSEAASRIKDAQAKAVTKGIILDQGIPRHGFDVLDNSGGKIGTVTSGTFSPILKKGIALSRVVASVSDAEKPWVMIRDSKSSGRFAKPPFYDEKVYGWKRQSTGDILPRSKS
jgi:aminomethyltransferase